MRVPSGENELVPAVGIGSIAGTPPLASMVKRRSKLCTKLLGFERKTILPSGEIFGRHCTKSS
jgi:hypothetical protein